MTDSAFFAEWQHRIAIADDEDAFLHLYKHFKQKLEKFAYSICHSKEDAEDIVEDVFVRIWTKRRTLDQVQNLKLYLYVATRNFSLNCCRLQQRNAHLDMNALKIELQDLAVDPQKQMIDAEQLRLVNQAVQELPTRCKIIFKLVKEDGLKQKEVAELLHLSPKTIENQLSIAIKRISLALGRTPKKRDMPALGAVLNQKKEN